MKELYSDLKKGEKKLKIESIDDLWCLNNILENGDFIVGKTERKIKLGDEGDRKAKIIKKQIFLKIEVEKIEFQDSRIKANGKITEGPDDIAKGSYHSFDIEEGTIITIIKKEWFNYQISRIKDACNEKISNILLVVLDRDEAHFALLKRHGYDLLSDLRGDVSKKAVDETIKGNFYGNVEKILTEYDERYKLQNIIVGSPAFWKEDLVKSLKNAEIRKKITQATVSSGGKEAFNELLKRKEIETVLAKDRISKEMKKVEQVLSEISKQGKASYGIDHVEETANLGAIEELLVSENLIKEKRENNDFERLENIMKTVDKQKGKVHIISSGHESGKKLEGIGGIAALLRYKLEY